MMMCQRVRDPEVARGLGDDHGNFKEKGHHRCSNIA